MQSSADMVALVHLIHTWEAEDGALTLLWYYAPLHLSQHVCHVHKVQVASLVPKVVATYNSEITGEQVQTQCCISMVCVCASILSDG